MLLGDAGREAGSYASEDMCTGGGSGRCDCRKRMSLTDRSDLPLPPDHSSPACTVYISIGCPQASSFCSRSVPILMQAPYVPTTRVASSLPPTTNCADRHTKPTLFQLFLHRGGYADRRFAGVSARTHSTSYAHSEQWKHHCQPGERWAPYTILIQFTHPGIGLYLPLLRHMCESIRMGPRLVAVL